MRVEYRQLFSKNINYLGFGFTHYFFSCLGQTFFISIFVHYFVSDIGITNDTFSIVYASATLSSAFLLPWIGRWADRVKIRYFSISNGLTLSLFCLLVSISASSYTLFFGLLGLRLTGQSLMPLTASTSIARYFDKERGMALSFSSIGLAISETIMPAIGIALINELGWEVAWRVLAISVWLVFIPISMLTIKLNDSFQLPKITDDSSVSTNNDKSLKEVLNDKRFYMIIPAVVFIPFFITGLFIHHNLMAQIKGWTMEWVATCFIGYGIVKTTTSFAAGSLVDRFSAKNIFPIHMVPLTLGVMFLLAGENKLNAIAYLSLAGMSTSLASISSTAMWAEIYGYRNLGSIKSAITTLIVFSSAIGPLVVGYLFENGFWNIALGGAAAIMVTLSLVSYFALRIPRK